MFGLDAANRQEVVRANVVPWKGPLGTQMVRKLHSTLHSPFSLQRERYLFPGGQNIHIALPLTLIWPSPWEDWSLGGNSGKAGAQTRKMALVLKNCTYQQVISFPRMLRKHIMAHWLPPSNSQELILQRHTLGKTFPLASWRCHPGGS